MKKNQAISTSYERGFTMIEVGIVLVIIALISGSILAGQTLVAAARVKSTITEVEQYQAAFNQFLEKFKNYPGDIINATSLFPGSGTANGNGNIRVEWGVAVMGGNLEGHLAWEHMALAGFVAGDYSDTTNANASITNNTPPAKIGGGNAGYHINNDTALGNLIGLAAVDTGGGINDQPVITTQQADDIDTKMDDGLPLTGIMRGQQNNAGECFSTAAGSDYDINEEIVQCWLTFKID